jgi:hypothetical protein
VRNRAAGCGASACSPAAARPIRNSGPHRRRSSSDWQQLGWTDDRNIRIDSRSGGGNADDIRKHATELTALAPDAIMVSGTAAVGEEFLGITTDSAKNART